MFEGVGVHICVFAHVCMVCVFVCLEVCNQ